MEERGSIRRRLATIVILVVATQNMASVILTGPGQAQAQDIHPGKLPYDLHCARCHGAKGLGDGPQAGQLKVAPPNFQSGIFQSKSDDQMLASMKFGEVGSQMHASRGGLTLQQMGEVLDYIRQLGRGR